MKTLIKGLAVFLLALFLSAGLAPSVQAADSAALAEGTATSPLTIPAAYETAQAQHRLANYQDLLAQEATKDASGGSATFTITLTLSADSPLIGHKPKDVLWLGGVVDTAGAYSKPTAFTFASAPADGSYTIKPVGGANFTDTDIFKEIGDYTIEVQVKNIVKGDAAGTEGNTDQNVSVEKKVSINFVFGSWGGFNGLSAAQVSPIDYCTVTGSRTESSSTGIKTPFFVPKAGLEDTQKELEPLVGQTMNVLDMFDTQVPPVQIDTATVVNFEIEYSSGAIAENTYTFGVDNHFVPQVKDGENYVSLLAADQQNSKSDVPLSQEGQFVIYEGSIDEVRSATSPLSAIEVGTFIKPRTTYTVRYAVLSDSTAPHTLDNTLRLVGPENLGLVPLAGAAYVAYPQADPKADYLALFTNTFILESKQFFPAQGYGYVLNPEPIYNLELPITTNQVTAERAGLTTNIVGQEGLKFVTYGIKVGVPDYTEVDPETGQEYIDLEPTINDIKVKDYLNNANGEEYTRIDDEAKAIEGGLFWVKDKDGNMVESLEGGKPTPLSSAKSPYAVYYTVAVNAETKRAESYAIVVSKTAQLSNKPPDLADTRFRQFANGPITVRDKDSAPWLLEDEKFEGSFFVLHYINGARSDSPSPVVASETSSVPVQSFAYTGFEADDAYIFTRRFVFDLKTDEASGKAETVLINKDTMRLVKYNPSNEFVDEFELIDMPTPPANMNDLKLLDGKFWIAKNGDGSVKTDGTEPFTRGAEYTAYFVIKDDGEFDNVKDPDTPDGQKVIQDPNGLFAQPRPSGGSSGCSVGGNNVYDLALLALLALGLVALRVRTRKG